MPRRAGSGGAREEETTSALARRPHCLREDGLRCGCCASARRRSDGAAASWIHGMNNSNWGMRTPQLLTSLLLSSGRGKLRRNRVCQAVYLVAVLGITIRLSRTLHHHNSHILPLILLLLSPSSVALSYSPGTIVGPSSSGGV